MEWTKADDIDNNKVMILIQWILNKMAGILKWISLQIFVSIDTTTNIVN